MRSTFKTLFYINRNKVKADGSVAVMCRITVDGSAVTLATGESCPMGTWNAKTGTCSVRSTDRKLAEFRKTVEDAYHALLSRDSIVSAQGLKNRLQGIETAPSTLLALGAAELDAVRETVGRSRTAGTYTNNSYDHKYLCAFVEQRGDGQDLPLSSIDASLFEEYRFHLRKLGLKPSTINRYLCWLSRLMFRAVSRRLIRYNPFEKSAYEREEKSVRFIARGDVAKLASKSMPDDDTELARRLFLFSCLTGLAIADMLALNTDDIKTGASGDRYLRKERKKTGVEYVVPLHPLAVRIIESYTGDLGSVKEKQRIFPAGLTADTLRKRVQVAGMACGIRQRLSFHMARHTFGTMCMSAGVPVESIAKMMGHASITSTQIYAKVTDGKISEDMDKLILRYSLGKQNEQ